MKLADHRPFGRTGVNVSRLTLGCRMFRRRTEPEDSVRIVDRALDAGINILDTANAYGRSLSGEFTGEALARNRRRPGILLFTKVHMPMDDTDPSQSCLG